MQIGRKLCPLLTCTRPWTDEDRCLHRLMETIWFKGKMIQFSPLFYSNTAPQLTLMPRLVRLLSAHFLLIMGTGVGGF